MTILHQAESLMVQGETIEWFEVLVVGAVRGGS